MCQLDAALKALRRKQILFHFSSTTRLVLRRVYFGDIHGYFTDLFTETQIVFVTVPYIVGAK